MNQTILQKIANFCAYQERTQAEVRQRLAQWRTYGNEAEEIIAWLIAEKFVNEERYAKSFARGKFRHNQWGKKKIVYALKQKQISKYCIQQALAEIDEDEYAQTLRTLLQKKYDSLPSTTPEVVRQQKTAQFALSKGFEMELIQALMPQNDAS